MKHCIVLVLLLSGILRAEDPAELTRLRESYDAAVKRSNLSLAQTYAKELESMLGDSMKAGKAADAAAINAELQRAKSIIASSGGGDAKPLAQAEPEPPANTRDGALIPSNKAEGYPLGPMKAGSQISLQYVSGRWKSWGRIPEFNPDDPKDQPRGEASRLVIAASPKDGVPGMILKVVPPDTAETPFVFTFPADHLEGVCLRIHDNSDHASNPGQVIYKIRITP